jgi:phage FluMu protein gp41
MSFLVFNVLYMPFRVVTPTSRLDFELKAIEIVMTANSPAAATNKAIVLYAVLPGF